MNNEDNLGILNSESEEAKDDSYKRNIRENENLDQIKEGNDDLKTNKWNPLSPKRDEDFSELNSNTQINDRPLPSTCAKSVKDTLLMAIVHTFPGESYNGELDENFTRNGYGIYEYYNGDIYEGDFFNGLRHGKGEYQYNDGSIYRGYWAEDKKHGNGTFKYDKYEFDGEWENDLLANGFTFKINKFLRYKSVNTSNDGHQNNDNSEVSEYNDSVSGLSNSFDSLDVEPLKMIEPEQLKQILAERYKAIQSKDYNIDIDLYHIKTGDSKANLINKIITNRLPVVEEETETIHDENCEFNKYTTGLRKRSSFNCHCLKFKDIIPKVPENE